VKRVLALITAVAVTAFLSTLIVGSRAVGVRHPELSLVKRVPLEVRGTGFGAHKMVRVSSGPTRVRVRSSARGAFVASLPLSVRCSGRRVVAVGSGGRRAVLRIPPMLCPLA
jgi:hypothetical protein